MKRSIIVTVFFLFSSLVFSNSPKEKNKDILTYALVDLETDLIVDRKNVDQDMILASISKLFTFYYALSVLGPYDQFKTKIFFTGNVNKKGLLKVFLSSSSY